MTDDIMREFTRAFCDALASHDPNLIAPWLDDDIDWTIYGPVDLFPFFGQRRGKAAVLAMCSAIDGRLTLKSCDKDIRLTDGVRSAALVKLAAVHKPTGRTLSLRMAMFAEVRDGKLGGCARCSTPSTPPSRRSAARSISARRRNGSANHRRVIPPARPWRPAGCCA